MNVPDARRGDRVPQAGLYCTLGRKALYIYLLPLLTTACTSAARSESPKQANESDVRVVFQAGGANFKKAVVEVPSLPAWVVVSDKGGPLRIGLKSALEVSPTYVVIDPKDPTTAKAEIRQTGTLELTFTGSTYRTADVVVPKK